MASLEKQSDGKGRQCWIVGSEEMSTLNGLPPERRHVILDEGFDEPVPYSYLQWLADLGIVPVKAAW